MQSKLANKNISFYAIDYLADLAQLSAGSGATDMTQNVEAVAVKCPDTLGGYSQGASIVTISIGIDTFLGEGETIPEDLAPRVKAVVTFGNTLSFDGDIIASRSPLYTSKAIEICNTGDPACGGGVDVLAHLIYTLDKSVNTEADQAAEKVKTYWDKLLSGLSFIGLF